MHISPTLSIYIGRNFLFWIAVVLSGLLVTVLLFDTIELLRRAAGRPAATFEVVVTMALLRLPELAQQLMPFVLLFATMLTFWRLTRSHELTVVRAAGVSVWQFLFPAVTLALVVGAVTIAVLNPIAAAFYLRFEQDEARFLRGRPSLLAVSPTGFWLRQADGATNQVIHALRVSSQDMELYDVIILNFENPDRFVGRIDAGLARLEEGYWLVRDAWLSGPDRAPRFERSLNLLTEMTRERIHDSFASPETISFWDLPGFIAILDRAGFSALRHRLHFQSLLAVPLLLAAMVLVAATFSLRPPRLGGAGALLISGIGAGFALFFLTKLVGALGQNGTIPVVLAAWAPTAVFTMLGVTMLLHLEDG